MLDPRVQLMDQAGLQNGRFSRGVAGLQRRDGGIDTAVAAGDAIRFSRARRVLLWRRRLGGYGVPDSDDGARVPHGENISYLASHKFGTEQTVTLIFIVGAAADALEYSSSSSSSSTIDNLLNPLPSVGGEATDMWF